MIELADTSAWVWSRRSGIAGMREAFDAALVDGFMATCDVVKLELLYGARNRDAFAEIREGLDALPTCPLGGQGMGALSCGSTSSWPLRAEPSTGRSATRPRSWRPPPSPPA